mgnify:FL=1
MNKRIEELKKEAAKQSAVMFMNLVFTDKQKTGDELFLEKFAELIIDECGEVAACNSHVSGYELKLLFKEHFGIEE